MKKLIFAGLIVATLSAYAEDAAKSAQPAAAPAQSTASSTVVVTTVADPTANIAPPTAVAAPTAKVEAAPVVVAQPEMAKQPTTVVEATPLVTSRAEQLRKQREQAEVETEQGIVEKLEQSRIDDEKRRQENVMGAIGSGAAAKKEEAKAEPAPVVVAAPAAAPGPTMEDVRNAVKSELEAAKPKEEKGKYYMSGGFGMVDYDSWDVESLGAFNISFGQILPTNWGVEAELGFSNHFVDDTAFAYRELDQYSLGIGGRFYVLKGRVRPSIGGVLQYVHRSYSEPRNGFASFGGIGELESDAVDAGVVAGVDVNVSDNLSLGLEYRFMSNISYRYQNEEVLNTPGFRNYAEQQLVEERDYDFWGFTLKYLF